MKKAAIFVISAVLFAVCLPVFAAQFPDVPTDHWAYAACQDLADKGVIVGYPDGTFGGKRALTRYEFAQALSRVIPVIAKLASTGTGAAGEVGPAGPAGPVGPAGPPGISPEELANIRRLLDEFKDELAAQGTDIQAIKVDLDKLDKRVDAVEREQRRVVITANALFAVNANYSVNGVQAFDMDSRALGLSSNPLQNNVVFDDIDLQIKGRVNDTTSVTALIGAGNYLPYAVGGATGHADSAYLYYLYGSSAVNAGPLGASQVTVGRMPFQLTPLTLQMVAPDSYIYDPILQNGDFPLNGGSLAFKAWKANVTVFAADSITTSALLTPTLEFGSGIPISQLAGARAVIGTPLAGNLGLTYYEVGPSSGAGLLQVYGGDFKATVAGIGIAAEMDVNTPSNLMQVTPVAGFPGIPNSRTDAWNANLSYKLGNFGLGAGYMNVGENYIAPGDWDRLGRAIDLQNVHGEVANLSYKITSSLKLEADGQFLQPNADNTVFARSSIDPSEVIGTTLGTIDATAIGAITGYRAGFKYDLTSRNSVDLGWEQVQWAATNASGLGTARENYYTVGFGHTFNANSRLKVLYQIVDYTTGGGGMDIYGDGNYRGGITTAEFQLKY